MNKLIANFSGWGRRIRTSPAGSRVRCPTARRSPKAGESPVLDKNFVLQIQSLLSKVLPFNNMILYIFFYSILKRCQYLAALCYQSSLNPDRKYHPSPIALILFSVLINIAVPLTSERCFPRLGVEVRG